MTQPHPESAVLPTMRVLSHFFQVADLDFTPANYDATSGRWMCSGWKQLSLFFCKQLWKGVKALTGI